MKRQKLRSYKNNELLTGLLPNSSICMYVLSEERNSSFTTISTSNSSFCMSSVTIQQQQKYPYKRVNHFSAVFVLILTMQYITFLCNSHSCFEFNQWRKKKRKKNNTFRPSFLNCSDLEIQWRSLKQARKLNLSGGYCQANFERFHSNSL